MTHASTSDREQTGSRTYGQIFIDWLRSLDSSAAIGEADLATWLDRGIVLAVILACGVALSLNVADPDLWGHIQYGRDALAHGLSSTTTYSYVARGYPWINHEILAEIALATIADSSGGSGLLMLKCVLGVAIVGTMLFRARRQGAGLISACVWTLLIAITLGNHWSLRPQLVSYVCFASLLALLSYCFAGWEGHCELSFDWLARWRGKPTKDLPPPEYSFERLKLLWLVPPLFMIWTNSHGGFLAGLCVYLAYLTFRGIEAVSRKGREAGVLVRRFALMGAAAVVATFLNPYGPRFHLWLYQDLAVPRPEIVEWRAPELFNTQFVPFWLLVVAAVASIARSRRPRDVTHVAILVLILWQALMHHRHIAFFAIACGWWLPMHFDSLLERLGIGHRFQTDEERLYGWAPPSSNAFCACLSLRAQQAMALFLVAAICLSTGQLCFRLTKLKVDKGEYPVAAFDYIARQGLTGKMVCTFNWAQYALAAFGPHGDGQPGILVQVDGRFRTSYSQEMMDMHFDFLLGDVGPDQRYRDPRSGPFDPQRVLEYERPDLVLISRLQRPSIETMEQQTGWILLYQDALAQVWGRASRYDDPKSAYYLEPRRREVGESRQAGIVRWPALPDYHPLAGADDASRAVAGKSAAPQPQPQKL
jgi:hypothetical protein